jgi:succinate dehydrogenase / fumarate reductase cytochrome b subunit
MSGSGTFSKASPRPFLFTSIGKKYLMGLTGLIWAGFVFGHMAGNMLMFISPDAYNSYGHALTSGYVIYAIETMLVGALLAHVVLAVCLTRENRKARGENTYAMIPNGIKGSSLASRTMAIQGSLILVFVILHLITFKFGTFYETTVNGVPMRDLHRLMVEVFKQPAYVLWYVISLVLLGFHLSHGFGSVFQSFGLREEKFGNSIKKLSWAYAIVVALGFLSQPIYIFFFVG